MNNKPTRAEVLEKMMNIKEKAADAVIADKDARIAELEAALKTAVRYLEHPEVKAIPFALPAESVVEHIQNLLKG